MGFWKEFVSGDNTRVNTPTVIATILTIPVIILALAALVFHIFILGRGLDSQAVALILGLMGGGGLGYGLGRGATAWTVSRIPPGWRPPPLV